MNINEENRIREAYRKRELLEPINTVFFGYESLAHLIRVQERHRETLRLLFRNGYKDLSTLRILDIGCGDGNMLRQFLQWGASPQNLAGIELRSAQVEIARKLNHNLDIHCGNAAELPWQDASFSLVCQHTVFTSILDQSSRKQVAVEMDRVLQPGGAVLWYDFIYNNPNNPDVRGIRLGEIRELFPGYFPDSRRITLAPPIARRIPDSMLSIFYPVLAVFPLLRTHLLILLKKPSE